MTKPPTITDDLILSGRALVAISDAASHLVPDPGEGMAEAVLRLVKRLADQTDFLAGIMQRMELDREYPPMLIVSDPGDIPDVEPVSEHDIPGRGHVIVCPYPFECHPGEAVGKVFRTGGAIWMVRGVEYQGVVKKGLCVGLVVRPIMGGPILPLASEAEAVKGDPYTVVGREVRLLGQPFCLCNGDRNRAAEAARLTAHSLNEVHRNLVSPPPVRLTEGQLAYACAAIEFCWDNEGGTLPTGDTVTEAELDDMLAQLRTTKKGG